MIERQILAIEEGEYWNNKRQMMDDTEININDG